MTERRKYPRTDWTTHPGPPAPWWYIEPHIRAPLAVVAFCLVFNGLVLLAAIVGWGAS